MRKAGHRQYWRTGRRPISTRRTRSVNRALILLAGWSLLLCVPAVSLVGGVPDADQTLARHTALLFNKGGMCSGVVMAPDVVLTAAHCAEHLGKGGRVFERPLVDVTDVAIHPQYTPQTNVLPDLALLKLSRPLQLPRAPVLLNTQPVAEGERLFIVGYGRRGKDDRSISVTPRMAMLVVSGRSEHLLRLTDPSHSGFMIADRGAKISGCDGDSGAPAFTMRGGVAALAGILSRGSHHCDGDTFVIPIATYLGWIRETARNWGAAIDSRSPHSDTPSGRAGPVQRRLDRKST